MLQSPLFKDGSKDSIVPVGVYHFSARFFLSSEQECHLGYYFKVLGKKNGVDVELLSEWFNDEVIPGKYYTLDFDSILKVEEETAIRYCLDIEDVSDDTIIRANVTGIDIHEIVGGEASSSDSGSSSNNDNTQHVENGFYCVDFTDALMNEAMMPMNTETGDEVTPTWKLLYDNLKEDKIIIGKCDVESNIKGTVICEKYPSIVNGVDDIEEFLLAERNGQKAEFDELTGYVSFDKELEFVFFIHDKETGIGLKFNVRPFSGLNIEYSFQTDDYFAGGVSMWISMLYCDELFDWTKTSRLSKSSTSDFSPTPVNYIQSWDFSVYTKTVNGYLRVNQPNYNKNFLPSLLDLQRHGIEIWINGWCVNINTDGTVNNSNTANSISGYYPDITKGNEYALTAPVKIVDEDDGRSYTFRTLDISPTLLDEEDYYGHTESPKPLSYTFDVVWQPEIISVNYEDDLETEKSINFHGTWSVVSEHVDIFNTETRGYELQYTGTPVEPEVYS